MPSPPLVVEKVYDFLRYIIPITEKFPRSQRYLLGERIESTSCAVLELLLSAAYSRERLPLLHQANVKVEQIRYFVRLCKDLRMLNLERYEFISKMLVDIGMQIGAWSKQQRGRQSHAAT